MTSFPVPSTASTSNDPKLTRHSLSYHQQRQRNRVFEEVVALFAQKAESEGLTKKELAARLGKNPSQITRWFAGPGNWTLDTMSDLLLAMGAEMHFIAVDLDEASSGRFLLAVDD